MQKTDGRGHRKVSQKNSSQIPQTAEHPRRQTEKKIQEVTLIW